MNSQFPSTKMSSKHVHTHTSRHRSEKLNPFFTISVQSDVLEIKRKGDGGVEEGKLTWEGRKKERHVFYLFLLFFVGFFFFSLQFPAPCCDFDKLWCVEKIYARSRSISTLSRAKQSPWSTSLGTHWKTFGKWYMGQGPRQRELRCCPGRSLRERPGRAGWRHWALHEKWSVKPLLERQEEPLCSWGTSVLNDLMATFRKCLLLYCSPSAFFLFFFFFKEKKCNVGSSPHSPPSIPTQHSCEATAWDLSPSQKVPWASWPDYLLKETNQKQFKKPQIKRIHVCYERKKDFRVHYRGFPLLLTPFPFQPERRAGAPRIKLHRLSTEVSGTAWKTGGICRAAQ